MNDIKKFTKLYIIASIFILFLIIFNPIINKKISLFEIKKNINNYIINKIYTFLVNKKIRNIEEKDTSFESNVKKVCEKASKSLREYYETYDTSIMDVSSMSFEEIEYYPDYIQSLFNIIEGKDEMKDNILKYLGHAFPAFMFFIFGIASVVAWFFFGFFCCCNCCCCCCCKKPECKCTCLVVPILFDLVIIGSCLFGIFNSSKMFTGLGDVECSLMKFISEINTGENKNVKSKWVGFDEILKTFEQINNRINTIKTDRESELNTTYETLTLKKEEFPENLTQSYKDLLDPVDPDSPLIFNPIYIMQIIREDTLDTLDVGVLDILYDYGPKNKDDKFLFLLNEQYKKMTEKADIYLEKAHKSFENILKENSVGKTIESSKKSVEELSISINDIKDKVAQYIIDYSDLIENYGSYIVKIIFIVIASLAGFSIISLIMMYLFTEEYCYGKCCCGKGLAKTLNHISWNLMSLVMIFSFLICGIVFLISYLGKDMIKVINIIFSKKNLYSKKPILITGDVKDYLYTCFHGDGDLALILGLTSNESSTYEFDELNSLMNDIIEIKNIIVQNDTVIKLFREKLENRKKYIDVNIYDFNETNLINLDKLINNYNDLLKESEFDEWTLNDTCPDENYILIHCSGTVTRKDVEDTPIPKECLNFEEWQNKYKKRYKSPPVRILHITYITVLKAANYYVNAVNNITRYIDGKAKIEEEEEPEISDEIEEEEEEIERHEEPEPEKIVEKEKEEEEHIGITIKHLEEQLDFVEEGYNDVIKTEIEALNIYNKTIYDLTSIFNELNGGSGSLFSFLNCKFIGNNALIILKNLNKAFGGSVQNIGITFIFASFGMFFSIVFTILEIIILNVSLYLQKRRKEKEEQIELSLGHARITTFTDTVRSEKWFRKKLKRK